MIKTLSSEGTLTNDQINLVKATLNNKDWHDKTTTLSGVGALIVKAVVTYLTAGAATGLVSAGLDAAIEAAKYAAPVVKTEE